MDYFNPLHRNTTPFPAGPNPVSRFVQPTIELSSPLRHFLKLGSAKRGLVSVIESLKGFEALLPLSEPPPLASFLLNREIRPASRLTDTQRRRVRIAKVKEREKAMICIWISRRRRQLRVRNCDGCRSVEFRNWNASQVFFQVTAGYEVVINTSSFPMARETFVHTDISVENTSDVRQDMAETRPQDVGNICAVSQSTMYFSWQQ